jgi:hypothetical protein
MSELSVSSEEIRSNPAFAPIHEIPEWQRVATFTAAGLLFVTAVPAVFLAPVAAEALRIIGSALANGH